MSTYNGSFVGIDLDGLADGRNTTLFETIHFLLIVDERPETADLVTVSNGLLDHIDGSLDAETKTVFLS